MSLFEKLLKDEMTTKRTVETLTVAACALALLANDVADTLPPGDTGELVVAAVGLAAAHPPGYPLFVWVYFTASRVVAAFDSGLPTMIGLNLFTALLVAVGVSLTVSCSPISDEPSGELITQLVLTYAVCRLPAVTMIGTQTEVFGLHFLLMSYAFRLTVNQIDSHHRLSRREWKAFLLKFGAVSGLAMGNQHISLFMLVPLSAVVAVRAAIELHEGASNIYFTYRRALPTLTVLAKLAAPGLALGLAIASCLYGSLVWMHMSHGKMDAYQWGGLETTYPALWGHVLRRNYGTFLLHNGRGPMDLTDLRTSLGAFSQWLWDESRYCRSTDACSTDIPSLVCGMIWACMLCIGVMKMVVTRKWLHLSCWALPFLSVALGFNAMVNLPLSTASHGAVGAAEVALHLHVVRRLWSHALIPLLHVCIVAVSWMRTSLVHSLFHEPLRAATRWLQRGVVVSVAILVVVCVSQRQPEVEPDALAELRRVPEALGHSLISHLKPNAVVVTVGDSLLTSIRFVQRIRKIRPDVLHIDRETSWYLWHHERFAEYPPPQFVGADGLSTWPKTFADACREGNDKRTVRYSDSWRPLGSFVNVNTLATALLSSINASSLYVMEDPAIATESPNFKRNFDLATTGWLYELRPKKAHIVSPTACPVKGMKLVRRRNDTLRCRGIPEMKSLEQFGSLLRGSDATRSDMSDKPTAPAVIMHMNVTRLSLLGFPWEASILQMYHVAQKNRLLDCATMIQARCQTTKEAVEGLKCVRAEAVHLLRGEYFLSRQAYDATVTPFLRLLNETLRLLSS